jgi:peptidoglycan/xylan/chitin deacetylase (PgdA/CDA1 family)
VLQLKRLSQPKRSNPLPYYRKLDWPGPGDFAICLTHDVDRVRKTRFHSLYYLVEQHRWHHFTTLLKDGNTYWNFDKIMTVEKKHGVRSTFFFLHEQRLFRDRPLRSMLHPREWVLYYSSCHLGDPGVIDIVRDLDKEGWEIGLHGSYESYASKDLLQKEKHTLESVIGKSLTGIRQHYLRLNIPTTWQFQREIGLRYDSSYGVRGLIEARDELIHPFHPFDVPFLVIPVTVMDRYLFNTCSSIGDAWERCRELLKWAKRNSGVVTVIWHSQQFNEDEFPGWSTVYERIIIEGKKMNAWIGPAKGVYEALRAEKIE